MKRRAIPLLFVLLVGLSAAALHAQQSPTPTVPAVPTLETGPTAVPTADASVLSPRALQALPVLINARNDIELLATTVFGSTDSRPEGWVQALDINDPQLAVLLRLNTEILAGSVFSPDERPDGWFGAVFGTPLAIARDIRHDLELIADRIMTTATIRPAGWAGDDPLMRCDRAAQALVTLVERAGFTYTADFSLPGACDQITLAAAQFAEDQLIQPDLSGGAAAAATPSGEIASSGSYLPFRAETPFVVAFLDRNARRHVGVLPVGTGFRPLNRSATQFSNMMLIGGENYEVWVDYTTTPLTTQQYYELTPVESDSGTFCDAAWCG